MTMAARVQIPPPQPNSRNSSDNFLKEALMIKFLNSFLFDRKISNIELIFLLIASDFVRDGHYFYGLFIVLILLVIFIVVDSTQSKSNGGQV